MNKGFVIYFYENNYYSRIMNNYGYYIGKTYIKNNAKYVVCENKINENKGNIKVYGSIKRAINEAKKLMNLCGYITGYEIEDGFQKIVYSYCPDIYPNLKKNEDKNRVIIAQPEKNETKYLSPIIKEEVNIPIATEITSWQPYKEVLYSCPNCGQSFRQFGSNEKFCHNCGVKINWDGVLLQLPEPFTEQYDIEKCKFLLLKVNKLNKANKEQKIITHSTLYYSQDNNAY